MSGLGRWILSVTGFLALLGIGPAWAQENVEAGKTPAQLYASDCAICHKSPNGLTKAGGLLGLQSFLREHYTASRETAAAIAQYLRTVDKGPPPDRKRTATPTRSTKDEKPKAGEKPKSGEKTGEKPAERRGKADSGKASDKKKPAEAKPAESKPAATKPAESKPADSKPEQAAAPKPPEKPPEAKPAATEPAPSKPADSKQPESKPADSTPPPADKPAKSD